MGKRVLIAEPRELIRTGLSIVFQREACVSEVNEVATCEEFDKCLSSLEFDLVVVCHTLITDMESLPQGKFALLVDEPDLNMMLLAYERQARGYFSVNITSDLLRATLNSSRDTFLVDPVLLPWMLELISDTRKRTDELQLLSPREREVITLLDEGVDRQNIASQLHISEATLKTHLKNIARKREDSRWSKKMLTYHRHFKRS